MNQPSPESREDVSLDLAVARALSESRRTLAFLLSPEGIILDLNEHAAQSLGQPKEKLKGLLLWSVPAAESFAEWQPLLQKVLKDQKNLHCDVEHNGVWYDSSLTPALNRAGSAVGVMIVGWDISDRKHLDFERRATVGLLHPIDASQDVRTLMKTVTLLLREWSGCEAVGIRLREGEDYPYFETRGFPPEFVLAETRLCAQDRECRVIRDGEGKAVLECMCGNVLCGRFNAEKPFFTANGSFWTNSTTELLRGMTEAERPGRARNRCYTEGYESLALIPMRLEDETFGLLQLNDHRTGCFTPEKISLLESLGSSLALALSHQRILEALRTNEERHRSVLASMTDGLILQAGDGTISECNRSAEAMLRLDREQIIGQTFASLGLKMMREDGQPFPIEEHPGMLSSITGNPIHNVTVGIRLPDGTRRWMNFNAEPMLKEGEDNPCAVVVCFSDITEHRRLEERLRQAQKMEGIGHLAGGMAHEFNNILAGLMMSLGLARESIAEAETLEVFADMEASCQRAASLIRQLLAFSGRSAMKPQPLDLAALVSGQLTVLRRSVGDGIRLDLSIADGLPWVKADKSLIGQVLMDLCFNARDAMPTGGQLRLELAEVEIDEEQMATHPDGRPGRYVRLGVIDTGCGMNEKTLQRLFEPFFTTKGVGRGTGLGLATVRGIVQQHEGWVEVESSLGNGSTFNVYLPVLADSTPSRSPGPARRKPAAGGATILVVEDEPGLRKVTRMVLARNGYKVLEAEDATQALVIWEAHQSEIDMIYTDMVMPGEMNGLQLAQRAMAERPSLKVIITSGYNTDLMDLEKAAAASIIYVPKPCPPARLIESIGKCFKQPFTGASEKRQR